MAVIVVIHPPGPLYQDKALSVRITAEAAEAPAERVPLRAVVEEWVWNTPFPALPPGTPVAAGADPVAAALIGEREVRVAVATAEPLVSMMRMVVLSTP